jgi:phosphotriesterase-related protein
MRELSLTFSDSVFQENFVKKDRDSGSAHVSRREAIGLLGAGAGIGLLSGCGGDAGLLAAPSQQAGASIAGKVTFPTGAIVRTVLKDISPETLATGTTLFHEHLSMGPHPYEPPPTAPVEADWRENVDWVAEEVKAAAKDGVSCIVSGGTRDLGQKAADVRRIGELVAPAGVHIVLSDALWTRSAYPQDIATKPEEQIADEFVRDAIEQRWGAIGELGSSSTPMHPDERKVFRAMAKVHLRTGLPIYTHNPHVSCPACALEQLDLLESQGVDLRTACIGHLSDIMDDPRAEIHKAVAKRGAFVGFDTLGWATGYLARPEEHLRMILSFLDAGYEDYALFSADGATRDETKRNGGPGAYSKVIKVFLPQLRAAGVNEATIHKILVDNPRRFLAFNPKKV